MRGIWIAAAAVWLGIVTVGLGLVVSYDNRPGVAARAPAQWPGTSRLDQATGTHTLVMVVHPRCDCSRASVAELAELMMRAAVKPRAYVTILKPEGLSDDWDVTSLRDDAMRIPGVKVIRDAGGIEARSFGAETSGQTLLYDPAGRLVFSGGITSARGHRGESVGRTAILAHLNRSGASVPSSSVFGCSLYSPSDQRWRSDAGQQ